MKYLSECDLIIYDLHSGNPQDVMLALEALRKFKFEEEKVLILISSLMAWSGTPKKLEELKTPEQLAEEARLAELAAKADAEGAEEDKPKEDEDEPPEEEDEDAEDKPKKDQQPEVDKPKVRKRYKHLPFSEKDYGLRNPIEEYKIIKEVEDEVLNFKKENVKTYVISADRVFFMVKERLSSILTFKKLGFKTHLVFHMSVMETTVCQQSTSQTWQEW
jgi:hypothetical protein